MKKIAMFTCLKSNRVCTGAACMKAYLERTKAFAAYEGEETQLVAFSKCNGCGKPLAEEEGLREKLDRLVSIGTDVVHLGLCTADREGKECPVITEVADELTRRGVRVVRGSH